MNRTLKDATVKRYFYETHDQLRAHLQKLRRRLQLRQAAQNPQGPNPIRIYLQSLDFRATQIQNQPAPANAGTKHLRCGRHWRQTDPSSSSGGVVGVERELDELFVPEGHISGSPLSETSTFLNTDLVSIGMFVATYTGVRALMRTGGQGMGMI